MYVAIGTYTVQPGKKAEMLAWYESVHPHMKAWLPGLITQYIVATEDENTVLSFAVYESEAAATAPPSSDADLHLLGRMREFATEDGIGDRKVQPILAHLP
ncbi:MAG TPA: antibiotic biosynthesis monooxygenase [Caldilineaceae bacterium]|nr:antibiotic biosynthesis monooxygenase [Caldilineaceae bacterium]